MTRSAPLRPRARRHTLAAALLAALVATAQAAGGPASVSGIDTRHADPAVRVQDDIYRSANGTWLANTPIPADKPNIGALEDIVDNTEAQLRGLIDEAAAKGTTPSARKVGDLYASFMDEATIEKLGIQPLAGELAAIDAVTTRTQLAALLAHLAEIGVGMPIAAYVGQDDRDSTRYVPTLWQAGLGLPDRDYYLLEDDARFKAARAHYAVFMAKLLARAGDADPKTDAKTNAKTNAEASAARVLAFETELARAQWTRVETRDPVKSYTLVKQTGLAEIAPGIDWPAYLGAAGFAGKTPDVIVGQPSYLAKLGGLVADTPLATWKDYARVRLLATYAPYLDKGFVDARFEFVGKTLNGTTENRPRWKRGVTLVDSSLGEVLGEVYVAKYFPPSSKARMEQLVANLLEAYRRSIVTLDWMGPKTKQEALAKLAKFKVKIGYPSRWIDYSSLEIRRDDLVGNVLRANAFETQRQLAKLGRPIDRDEWGMTPQTVNAYYNPPMNEIVFPAAFLQPPAFTAEADDAVNYGAVGAVIGHEISHGFDDSGSQYDGDGNLRDWWTAEDRARYKAKTAALVAQYAAFQPVKGYHIDGELTLGENIADNAGLAIALKAYHLSLKGKPAPFIDKLSGDTRFFRGWAQAWRGKQRDESLVQQLKSDPHSPDEFRVNGAVRNQPGFYATFGVKPGDKLYLAPAKRVILW